MSIFLDALKWIPAGFKLLGAAVPLLRGLIEGFESVGHGEEKKAAVLAALGKIIDETGTPERIKTFVLWACGWLIDAIVAFKNAIGAFMHKEETS